MGPWVALVAVALISVALVLVVWVTLVVGVRSTRLVFPQQRILGVPMQQRGCYLPVPGPVIGRIAPLSAPKSDPRVGRSVV